MNHSFYSADRTTHLKIVVAALLAAIALSSLSLSLHYAGSGPAENSAAFEPGKPIALTGSTITLVR